MVYLKLTTNHSRVANSAPTIGTAIALYEWLQIHLEWYNPRVVYFHSQIADNCNYNHKKKRPTMSHFFLIKLLHLNAVSLEERI